VTPGGGSWNVLITVLPSWVFDVPLATAICKNLPAENTQRYLSRQKPTRVAVPIEEEEEEEGRHNGNCIPLYITLTV